MSRLADYFVIVGYDHEKERKEPFVKRLINFKDNFNIFEIIFNIVIICLNEQHYTFNQNFLLKLNCF